MFLLSLLRTGRKALIGLMFIPIPYLLRAQNQPPQITPPSPDAAALAKFTEMPVGTYTGIPKIDIPLYEVKAGPIVLPIALSYHAGGIKVEDIASNVGLGWTLNAGGVITRSMLALPDEMPTYGFFNNVLAADLSNADSYLKQLSSPPNQIDGQPDEYYFNFGKYSGKLIFSKDGTCYTIPHNSFKIKPGVGPLQGANTAWEITTEEGIKYTFTKTETTEVTTVCTNSGGIIAQPAQPSPYISSWYLTRIEDFHTANFIDITYFSIPEVAYDTKVSRTHTMIFDGMGSTTTSCDSQTKVKFYSVINTITYPGGVITFDRFSRLDFGGQRIGGFKVENYKGELIKKYKFWNDLYFDSGCEDQKCKRLKLSKVSELGNDGVIVGTHAFEYNGTRLPPRDSKDTDYWGYYNMKGNTADYPEFVDYFNESVYFDYLPGANKRPDESGVKACTLTKITYPTGGTTAYEYQINEVVNSHMPFKELATVSPAPEIKGDGPQSLVESAPFTITGYTLPGLYVKATYRTTGCKLSEIVDIQGSCPTVKIVGVGNSTNLPFQNGTLTETVFFLPNGQYKLQAVNVRSGQSFNLKVTYKPEVNSPNKQAGGLRVLRITNSDNSRPDQSLTTPTVRKYLYNDINGSTTGRLTVYPVYYYANIRYESTNPVSQWIRSSENNATLATTQGSYVGYGYVKELRGETGEFGSTEYWFTSLYKSELAGNTDYMDTPTQGLPFGPPAVDNDWKRGFLSQQIDYWNTGGIQRNTIAEYSIIGTGTEIRGTKVAVYEDHGLNPAQNLYRKTVISRYGKLAFLPKNKLEYVYSDNANGMYTQTRSDFTYNPGNMLLKEEQKTLRSDLNLNSPLPAADHPENFWTQTIKYKYPPDYTTTNASDSMSLALKTMATTLNKLNTIIEKQVWEQRNDQIKLVDAELNLYYINGLDLFKQLKLKSSAPLGTGEYTTSYIDGAGHFVPQSDKLRSLTLFSAYDATTGNVTGFHQTDGLRKAYVWGYKKQYPIAEFTNATAAQVFYTSFEDTGEGNSTTGDAWTGNMSKTDGFTTALSSLTSGNYKLSYWTKIAGAWQLQEVPVTVSGTTYTISLTGQVDEVRFCPVNALTTTYVYKPGVGLQSLFDSNHAGLFYEYDPVGRLKLIRNNEKHITRTFEYNYIVK